MSAGQVGRAKETERDETGCRQCDGLKWAAVAGRSECDSET